MRKLILMRHAKSDWSSDVPDHDRPLNGRGRRAATALGDWLRKQGHLPDAALVSSAARTVETAQRLALSCPAHVTGALYLAHPDRMAQVLKQARGDAVLMLGHNPGIARLAAMLLASPPGHGRFGDYPTGATLVAEFPIDSWSELTLGTGRATDFAIPRELPGTE